MIWLLLSCVCVVFFFKQKTAYEMRISDWSSDVCSSDLRDYRAVGGRIGIGDLDPEESPQVVMPTNPLTIDEGLGGGCNAVLGLKRVSLFAGREEIGRASCRERVGQYV